MEEQGSDLKRHVGEKRALDEIHNMNHGLMLTLLVRSAVRLSLASSSILLAAPGTKPVGTFVSISKPEPKPNSPNTNSDPPAVWMMTVSYCFMAD